MLFIPDLVPFNFVKAETIDYKTVFPNKRNSQPDNYVRAAECAKFPINVIVEFLVWTESTENQPILTVDGVTADISYNSIETGSSYQLWSIELTLTEAGTASIELTSSFPLVDGTYNSNFFTVVDSLEGELFDYGMLEFSNNSNDFDYWFVDGAEQYYYKYWTAISNIKYIQQTEITTREDDYNDIETGFAAPTDGVEVTIPINLAWQSKLINHISACSEIKLNGISYTPISAIESEQVFETKDGYNIVLTLQENKITL